MLASPFAQPGRRRKCREQSRGQYRNWRRGSTAPSPAGAREAATRARSRQAGGRDRPACRDGSHFTTGRNRSRCRDTARRRRNHRAGSPRGRAPRPSRAPRRGRQGCRRWPRHQRRARRATAHAARRQPRSRTRLAPHGCNSGRIAHHCRVWFEPIGAPLAGSPTRAPRLDRRLGIRRRRLLCPSAPGASDDAVLPQLCDGCGVQAQPVG
jgi:hypothetical protein